MKNMVEMQMGLRQESANRTESRLSEDAYGYVWAVCGAGIGFVGGLLAPLFGAVFTILSRIEGTGLRAPIFERAGTICFFLTIPLLIFGGACLDALEKRGWKSRLREKIFKKKQRSN